MKNKFVPLFLIPVFAYTLYFVVFSGKVAPRHPFEKSTLFDKENKEVRISDFKGSVIIVSYFKSWCGDCRREQPELEALQQAVGGENKLKILLVSDEGWGKIDATNNFTKTNLKFYQSEKSFKTIGMHRFPTTYLLNKKGEIVEAKVEGIHWNTKELQDEVLKLNK